MSTLVDKTTHEVWNGKKSSVKHLKVFVCDAYVHVPKEKRSKLDNKVKKVSLLIILYSVTNLNLSISVTKKTIFN